MAVSKLSCNRRAPAPQQCQCTSTAEGLTKLLIQGDGGIASSTSASTPPGLDELGDAIASDSQIYQESKRPSHGSSMIANDLPADDLEGGRGLQVDFVGGETDVFVDQATQTHASTYEREDLIADGTSEAVEHSSLHLFVLVHGIIGSANDFDFWENQMRERRHKNWEIMKAESIREPLSFPEQINPWRLMKLQDLAEPLVAEIVPWVESFAQDGRKIWLHFVCHSLGGLLVRTALPALCAGLDKIQNCSLDLGHFLTLNSPHIGIQAKRKRYKWKHLVKFKDLHQQVKIQDNERFLEKLADPREEYLPHLAKFRYRTAVAATHWDLIVPFCTAAVCSENPFPRQVIPSLFGSSFWHLDAATGFDNKDIRSMLEGLLGPDTADPAERLRSHVKDLESQSVGLGDTTSEQWNSSDDGSICFPPQMLNDLASVGWRRIAFTLHWTGVNPHTFPIGRPKCEWSQKLIGALIDVLEEEVQLRGAIP